MRVTKTVFNQVGTLGRKITFEDVDFNIRANTAL
jgi:hypothetical protein